jgi:hypothetical protein
LCILLVECCELVIDRAPSFCFSFKVCTAYSAWYRLFYELRSSFKAVLILCPNHTLFLQNALRYALGKISAGSCLRVHHKHFAKTQIVLFSYIMLCVTLWERSLQVHASRVLHHKHFAKTQIILCSHRMPCVTLWERSLQVHASEFSIANICKDKTKEDFLKAAISNSRFVENSDD